MVAAIVTWVAYVLSILIFARALLSWIPSLDRSNPLVSLLEDITEPILAPIRSFMPRGAVDLSPMIAGFILLAIAQAVSRGA